MKQKLLYILLFVFSVLFGTGDALAQTSYYVYESEDPDKEIAVNNATAGPFELSGPGAVLTYSMWNNATNENNRKVEIYASYESSKETYTLIGTNTTNTGTTSWDDFSMNLNAPYDGYIKFVGSKGNFMATKRIKNVKVTRASQIIALSPTALTAEAPPGETNYASLTVSYGNTNNMGQIRVSHSSGALTNMPTLEQNVTDELGSVTFDIPFSAANITTEGTYTGKLKVEHLAYNGSAYVVDVTKEIGYTFTVKKTAPTIDFKEQTFYPDHVYDLSTLFDSPNEDTTPVATISNGNAVIIGDKLFILSTGSFTISVTQQGSDKWETTTQTRTINVQAEATTGTHGNITLAWSGSDATVTLPAPCSKVTFDISEQFAATGGMTVRYYDAATSGWTTLLDNWSDMGTDNTSFTYDLPRTATQLQFTKPSTLEFYVKNIVFYYTSYMTVSPASLSLGEVMQGNTSAAQDARVDWGQVTSSTLTAFSDNSAFSVTNLSNTPYTSTNSTWDEIGYSSMSVQFTPQTTGTHTGYIYFHDNKRFVRIPVSGTALSNHLKLEPTVDLSTQQTGMEYPYVTLNRTLNSGHSTLTLPFDTNVSEVSGYTTGDYVAQLALVTYNAADGYTLYFKQVADGTITAHQPYVINRTSAVTNPQWTNCHVNAPSASTIEGTNLQGWTMTGNYTPSFSMTDKYGIAGGELRKGTSGSTLNAYTAYFTPPASAQNVRTRVAIMDEAGNTTYIGEIRDGQLVPEAIYGVDGTQQTGLKNGINIVRTQDGTVRKIWKR